MIGFLINPDPEEKEEDEKRFNEAMDQVIKNRLPILMETTKRYLSRLRRELPCKVCGGRGITGKIRHHSRDNPLRILCEDCGGTGIDEMGKEV